MIEINLHLVKKGLSEGQINDTNGKEIVVDMKINNLYIKALRLCIY